MNRALQLLALVPIVFVVAAGTVGCSAGKYSATMHMSAAHRTQVTVYGRSPSVIVENHGPGDVDAIFNSGSDASEHRHIFAGVASGRTVPHGSVVEIFTHDDLPATVIIISTGATGMAIDQAPNQGPNQVPK